MSKFTFTYIGKGGHGYQFRAPTWPTSRRKAIDALAFENIVVRWCVDNTTSGLFFVGNSAKFNYKSKNGLCVILQTLSEVYKFQNDFKIRNLTPETIVRI